MSELQKIIDLLRQRPYFIEEVATYAEIELEKCKEYIDSLKGLGLVYERKSDGKREIYLRQLPVGPRIGVMSVFKAIDDIVVLNENPPKPEQIIDLVE